MSFSPLKFLSLFCLNFGWVYFSLKYLIQNIFFFFDFFFMFVFIYLFNHLFVCSFVRLFVNSIFDLSSDLLINFSHITAFIHHIEYSNQSSLPISVKNIFLFLYILGWYFSRFTPFSCGSSWRKSERNRWWKNKRRKRFKKSWNAKIKKRKWVSISI